MKKTNIRIRRMALLLSAMLLFLPCLSVAESPTVTVNGTATIQVAADEAVVSLGVVSSAKTAAEASEKNAELVSAVLGALRDMGVEEKDIQTRYFYVSTRYDYTQMEPVVTGYEVSNQLSVTVHDISKAGDVIDTALHSGANSVDGISYLSTQSGEANDQALQLAIAEGRRKAELAAAASGMKLGELVSVTESYGSYSGAVFSRVEAAKDAGFATQVFSGDLDISATVVMVYALESLTE
ncbi:MAG: SIMPL domain-containing protein [Clostridia bacterium]|nr:SIMPL domain-containing protein [Clostridia bacterium]